jgi:formylglycine-generating enzyme required for sulfatase activity
LHEFWIGFGPVTNAQFARFVEATQYRTTAEAMGFSRIWTGGRWMEVERAYWRRPEGPRSNIDGRLHHPVVCVSWFDAQAYCEWAGLRLPSEKEWEKAARGTDGRLYPWGNQAPASTRANFAMCHGTTTPAGEFSPAGDSPYGLNDMAGNIWEWTASWLEDPPAGSEQTRVVRGGAWSSKADHLQVTYRLDIDPYLRFNTLGFRASAHLGDPGF